MAKENNNDDEGEYNSFLIGILVILIFIAVLFMGYVVGSQKENVVLNNPSVNVWIYDWAINLYDESEMFFDYTIYNYGDTEAKNIVVECKLDSVINGKYDLIKTTSENIGNIASNSAEFGEIITNTAPSINDYDEYAPYCYVKSCDNCEIIWKNIPELVENYGQ